MANVFDQFDEPAERPKGERLPNPFNGKTYAYVDDTGGGQPKPAAEKNVFDQFDESKQPKKAGALERVMALPAGVNRAAYTVLPGLPVDTAASVLDLGKAAIGYATSKITGDTPPAWTEPFDRKNVVGSSDWFAKQINNGADLLDVRSPINNPAPDDPAARVMYSGGLLAGSSINPDPRAKIGAIEQLTNIGSGAVGGLASGAVGEKSPEWAGVVGMAPQVATAVGAGAVKRAIRGGEEGRRNMEQRIQDFKAAGVDAPSVGLASGNQLVQGVENLLSLTPGSVGIFERSKQRMINGMQAKTNQIRDDVSPTFGPVEAGAAMQKDLKGAFKGRIGDTYAALNDRFAATLPQDQRFPINSTLGALDGATAVNPLAPNTSASFVQPRIDKLRSNILADTTTTQPTMYGSNPVNQGLPISAIKEVRTAIGKEAASNAIVGTPEQAQWKQVYGGLTNDMRSAAKETDLSVGPQPNNMGPSERLLDRSNAFYRNAMNRVDNLNSLANRNTPEGAYSSVAKSLEAGPTTYARVRNAVTPETRKQFVATVIDDLGKANPGQQGAAGDVWSPRTFLTNYNKLDQQAKAELFKRLPGGKSHAENLEAIAKVADMIGQGSKVWANPSGTAAATAARGAFGAIGVGALFEPITAATVAGGLALGNAASRLLVSPIFANWLAKAPKSMTPEKMQSYTQRLIVNAKMSGDPQLARDVEGYLRLVKEGQGQSQ